MQSCVVHGRATAGSGAPRRPDRLHGRIAQGGLQRRAGKHGEAQPVIQPEGLEATVAAAVPDQHKVPERLRGNHGDAGETDAAKAQAQT